MEGIKQDLTKSKKKLGQVLKELSPVMVYDACQHIKQKRENFKLPDMPELGSINLVFDPMSMNELVKKALGEVECSSNKYLNPKHVQSVYFTAVIPNEDPSYYSIRPVTEDTAWCVENVYDKAANTNCISNKLCMINSQGQVQKRLQTSADIRRLFLHTSTGVLYGTFNDNTICTIDTKTGTITNVVQCSYEPCCLSITPAGNIIVGEHRRTPRHMYRYSPDGQLLYRSVGMYKVHAISYSAINSQVAVASGSGGVTVMNGTLTYVLHTQSIRCYTSIYDVDGSLMIGDYIKKAILILDGKTFSTIKSFTLPEMSHPEEIRLCDSSMWVKCTGKHRIVHAIFQ